MAQWSALRRVLVAGRGLGAWRQPWAAVAVVRRLRPRAWPARRVALGAVAGLLLLSAALLGHFTPTPSRAQEGEAAVPQATAASGVSIRLDDLVDRITYTIVDRFEVQVAGLDASAAYEVRVSSDSARLGFGGCGTATQTQPVTGVTSQDVLFIVWACGLGRGTVTAEVREAGAAAAEVTVSQELTVLPIPDYVPAAERRAAERSLAGAAGATAVRTPGIVMNLQHGRFATEIEYTWSKPASGSFPLSGYGVLMWKGSEQHPGWGEAVNLPTSPRRKRYTGLELNTLYKFRIHACSEDRKDDGTLVAVYCGWWTDIHEVRTGKKPKPPHTISFDQRTTSSARATWSIDADSGGVPRTGFQIRYWPRSNTSDTTTVHVTEKDARRHTLTGLTAGTRYAAKLRTCNDTQSCTVGDWSADHWFETTSPEQVMTPTATPTPVAIDPECPTISGTAVLPENVQVEVVPQPRRLVSLCWSPSLYATSYFVQATDNLSNLHDPNRSGWQGIHGTADQPHVADKAQRLQLDLDQLITTSGSVVGLADNAAYGIRIRMRTVTNGVSNITYTKAIIIVDSPIVEANGAGGTAKIQWDTTGTVLQNTGFGTGSYELRHRQSTGDLKSLGWTPKEFALPAATPFTATTNPDTLNLTPDHIHAVQLIYRDDPNRADSPDADVFAARNVYVWPSTTTPTNGYRLATYHLSPRLSDQTLVYRICLETFGPTTDPRTGKWEALIPHAFERWSTATHGLVKVSRVLSPCAEAEGEYPPGTGTTQTYNYKRMADDIIALSGTSFNDSQVRTQIRSYMNDLRGNGVVGEIRKQNAKQREIIMLNDIDLDRALRIKSLFDFADDLGYWKSCWFKSDGSYDDSAAMCTVPVPGGSAVNHDIIVRRSAYYDSGMPSDSDMLEVPEANARFNKCLNGSDRVPPDGGSAYNHMLHEIGHVIGLGGGSSSLPPYYRSHPGHSIVSVMNYVTEPDCAPHVLDVMAVFAIYQNRFTTS